MLGERITDTHIYFWNGVFCQWGQYTMVEEDITYCSCEQYMMAKKAKLFNDEKVYDMIMSEEYPSVQKELGKMVSNFNQVVWDKHKFDIVVNANYLKFTQNETLKESLSPVDDNDSFNVSFWVNFK